MNKKAFYELHFDEIDVLIEKYSSLYKIDMKDSILSIIDHILDKVENADFNLVIELVRFELDNSFKSSDLLTEYLSEINNIELLSEEELVKLYKMYQLGDERAIEKIVQANLKLVVYIAKKFSTDKDMLIDLIEEGNLGLIIGAKRFDYTRGYKFSNYVSWWIKDAITRYIKEQESLVIYPKRTYTNKNKLLKEQSMLTNELNREVSIREVLETSNYKELEKDAVVALLNGDTSLDKIVSKESFIELRDLVASGELTPEELIMKKDLRDSLYAIMDDVLTDREKKVLELRYGLNDEEERSFESIGSSLNTSRENARKMHGKALKKMIGSKHNSALNELKN